MPTFNRLEQKRARLGQPIDTEARLPLAQSASVIVGLSALSWGVLISIVMGLRAVL